MAGLIFDTRPRDKKVPQKLLLVDLDGTVRTQLLKHYPEKPEEVEVFKGVPELLVSYMKLGWSIMAISNQGGIGKGETTSEAVHACMLRTNELCAGAFDGFVWCPHHPLSKNPDMASCFCRKPKYGMIVQAQMMMQQVTGCLYPIRLMKFVGDQPEDEEAATAAGVPFVQAEKWRAEILTMNLMAFNKPPQSKIIQ